MTTASTRLRRFKDGEMVFTEDELSRFARRWLGAIILTAWAATWGAVLTMMYVTEPTYVAGFRDTDVTVTCRALSGSATYTGSLDTAGLVTNPGGADAVVQELYGVDETTLEDVYEAYFDPFREVKEGTPHSEITYTSDAVVNDYTYYEARLQKASSGCELERTARASGLGIGSAVALVGIILIAGTMIVRRTLAPATRVRRRLQRALYIVMALAGLAAVVTVHAQWTTNPSLDMGDGTAHRVQLTCRAVSATPESWYFEGTYLTIDEPLRYLEEAGLDSDTYTSNVIDGILSSFTYYTGSQDAPYLDAWQTEQEAMAATQTVCSARRDEQLATLNMTLGLSVIVITLLQGAIIFTRLRPTGLPARSNQES